MEYLLAATFGLTHFIFITKAKQDSKIGMIPVTWPPLRKEGQEGKVYRLLTLTDLESLKHVTAQGR
jgi:hypothetical protein